MTAFDVGERRMYVKNKKKKDFLYFLEHPVKLHKKYIVKNKRYLRHLFQKNQRLFAHFLHQSKSGVLDLFDLQPIKNEHCIGLWPSRWR